MDLGNSIKEKTKYLILWGVAQFCRLPISFNRLWLSDKFYFKLRPKQTLYPIKIGKYKVIVDLAEFQPRLMYFHHYERDIIKCIKEMVKPNQVCLDIGANIGFLSAVMGKAVGDKGKIYSLEPNHKLFPCLITLAESSNGVINPFQLAVSDKNGILEFYLEANHALSTCVESLHSATAQKILVKTISIDDFCSQQQIFPDFIKIDVEGAEPLVLKGMQKLFESGHRPIILCELKPWTYDVFNTSPEDVLNLVLQYGYKTYVLNSTADLVKISTEGICKSQSDVNVIFLP